MSACDNIQPGLVKRTTFVTGCAGNPIRLHFVLSKKQYEVDINIIEKITKTTIYTTQITDAYFNLY